MIQQTDNTYPYIFNLGSVLFVQLLIWLSEHVYSSSNHSTITCIHHQQTNPVTPDQWIVLFQQMINY